MLNDKNDQTEKMEVPNENYSTSRNEMAMVTINTLHAGQILEKETPETFWIRCTFTIKHGTNVSLIRHISRLNAR